MAWLGRIVLAIGFLAVVWLVAKPTVQGKQTPEVQTIALPLMIRNAALAGDPSLRDYVGMVYAFPNTTLEGAYYTVRGDGSEWTQITPESPLQPDIAWSPNGLYYLYSPTNTAQIVRLSDGAVIATLPFAPRHRYWSPDSTLLLLYDDGSQKSYIFDIESLSLRELEGDFAEPLYPVWSPDSRSIAWLSAMPYPADRELWIWQRDTSTPIIQVPTLQGTLQWEALYWSPDSTQLALKGQSHTEEMSQTIITTMGDIGNHVILEGYITHGWVEGGAWLVVQQGGRIYLASPDGQTLVPFSDPTQDLTNVVIALSDHAMLYIVNGTQFLHTVGQIAPVELGPAFCNFMAECSESFSWKADGTRFLHSFRIDDRNGGWDAVEMGDSTTTPPRYISEPVYKRAEQFLPFSTHYVAVFESGGGYPGPVSPYSRSYILNGRTGDLWFVPYEANGQARVREWRYMP